MTYNSKCCLCVIARKHGAEEYRSGHNGPDSKSGEAQVSVGSNPTSSANVSNPNNKPVFRGEMFGFVFYLENCISKVRQLK